MHVLIAGCGWLGEAVAARLAERGDRVTAVRRDPARAEALRAPGVTPLALDLADPGAPARIPHDVEAILALQAPREAGEAAHVRAYLQASAHLLEAARDRGARPLVFTSSTRVFGQEDGSEVDEATPPCPAGTAARILLEAEALVRGGAGRVVRLSGLYGPGRYWMVDRVRSGAFALGPGDRAWLNSCHRDDAVEAVLAVLDRGRDGAVYHATDAGPMRRGDVVRFVAGGLGLAPPVAPGEPGGGLGRRVRGEKSREELGLALAWPSLREGLGAYLTS
jgi:nucleoside-diphosphate-sugar epimerase